MGFFWFKIPNVSLSVSYNDLHIGRELLATDDGMRLLVKRGWRRPGQAIWADCIEIGSKPPRMCSKTPDCCMSGPEDAYTTDRLGLLRHSKKVEQLFNDSLAVDPRNYEQRPGGTR